jgi:hypothetical protein
MFHRRALQCIGMKTVYVPEKMFQSSIRLQRAPKSLQSSEKVWDSSSYSHSVCIWDTGQCLCDHIPAQLGTQRNL